MAVFFLQEGEQTATSDLHSKNYVSSYSMLVLHGGIYGATQKYPQMRPQYIYLLTDGE